MMSTFRRFDGGRLDEDEKAQKKPLAAGVHRQGQGEKLTPANTSIVPHMSG